MAYVNKMTKTKNRFPGTVFDRIASKHVDGQQTRAHKIAAIKLYVKEKFSKVRNEKMRSVSISDLQQWSLEKAREVNLEDFICSRSFLDNLKIEMKISFIKINKYTTMKQLLQLQNPEIKNFVKNIRQIISDNNILPCFIFNLDQSGFSYEVNQNRTYSTEGEKTTYAVATDMNRVSHSYSIQVAIAASGKIAGPTHICLQEATASGSFGPLVTKTVNEFMSNFDGNQVIVSSTKSGKFHAGHHEQYLAALMKTVPPGQKALLLKDSWTGQTGRKASDIAGKYPNLITATISPGTTSVLQPEDVYYFSQLKRIYRKAGNHVAVNYPELKLSERLNTLALQVHIQDQLLSPKFREMIRYAWTKSGYLDDDEGVPFQNVNNICFEPLKTQGKCQECPEEDLKPRFICCSHCELQFCFKHFLTNIFMMLNQQTLSTLSISNHNISHSYV